jgi:hypothetical protein
MDASLENHSDELTTLASCVCYHARFRRDEAAFSFNGRTERCALETRAGERWRWRRLCPGSRLEPQHPGRVSSAESGALLSVSVSAAVLAGRGAEAGGVGRGRGRGSGWGWSRGSSCVAGCRWGCSAVGGVAFSPATAPAARGPEQPRLRCGLGRRLLVLGGARGAWSPGRLGPPAAPASFPGLVAARGCRRGCGALAWAGGASFA